MNQTNNITTNTTINVTQNQTINITLNETLPENDSKELCNISLGIRIKDDKLIYYNKETIKFYNILNMSPYCKSEYVIEYWIEDVYGNILKSKVQTSNLNEKSYTPSVSERTVAIIIRNEILNFTCNDSTQTNIINGSSEKILIIKNPDYTEKECKKCETCASDIPASNDMQTDSELNLEIKDGSIIIDSYRGDDRKYVVNAYIKNDKNRKVADLVKFSLEKYSGVNIELPLLDACGEFKVFAEGLGFVESKEYGVDCKNDTINKEFVSNMTETFEKDLSIKDENAQKQDIKTNVSEFFHDPLITGNIIYESKNEKTKDYSLIGIIVLIAGIIIYIAYKTIIHKRQR
jgi:hypothetical protein